MINYSLSWQIYNSIEFKSFEPDSEFDLRGQLQASNNGKKANTLDAVEPKLVHSVALICLFLVICLSLCLKSDNSCVQICVLIFL